MKKKLLNLVSLVALTSSLNAQVSFTSVANYTIGGQPYGLSSADFNSDGKADLVVANYDLNNIAVFLGSGTGTFAPAVNYATGANPHSVISADFNGDGKVDLATANYGDDNVSVLLGSGTGTFTPAVNYGLASGIGNGPIGLTSADFNGDGKADIATGNYFGTTSILLGSGIGTFSSAINYGSGTQNVVYSIVSNDLNGDGKIDLALTSSNTNNVSVFYGTGTGVFATEVNFGVGTARSIISNDFNGDGKKDLAVANGSPNEISVLLGNGTSTLTAAVNYGAGSGSLVITSADFNVDGKVDLASSSNVFLGLGNGTFPTIVNYSSAYAMGIVSADFNGDGKPDLATGNYSSFDVSILLNTTCIATLSLTGQSNVLCNGGATGSATVTASGGAPYTYTWSPSGGNASVATGLSAGNYTCVVTNSCGATASTTVNITQPTALTTATALTNVSCNGGSTGSATITASGGTSPYSYLWSTGATTSVITSQTVGLKTVTVTDANSCSNTRSVTILQPSALSVFASASNTVICAGSVASITVSASGGTPSYTGIGTFTTNVASITYTVTDVNGCTATKNVSLTINPSPTITVNSGTITSGSSFTLAPSGGVSYTYTPAGPVVTPTTGTTTYTVIGSNASGCVASVASTVFVNGAALDFDGIDDYVNCGNILNTSYTKEAWIYISNLSLANNVVSGGFPVAQHAFWATGSKLSAGHNGNWTACQDPAVLLANTWYHVACTYDAATTTLKLYKNGTLVASNTSIPSYTGGNLALIGSHQYASFFGGKMDEVRIWNRALCQGEIQNNMNGEIATTAPGLIANYHFNQGLAASNNTGVTTLNDASGSSNNGALTNFANTGTVSNWVAPGAVNTGTTVTAFISPTVAITGASAICIGASTTFTAIGLNTYTWTAGPTTATNTVSPSVTTTYSVIGTATNGCVSSMAIKTITVNALPTVSVSNGAICSGSSFTIAPSGATTYTVSGGSTVVSPTTTSSYSVTGTDANGCVSSNTAVSTVTVNALPTVSVSNGVICSGNSFTIAPSGASTYTVSGGSAVVSPTTTTNYSVTGTSAAGCVSSNTAVSTVTVNALPSVSAASSSSLLCSGQYANITASGATSYTWNTSATTSVIAVSPTITTSYTVNGTDANGCSNVATITQNVNTCTGIVSVISVDSELNMYPNPFRSSFTISYPSMDGIEVSVTDVLGNTIYTTKLNEEKTEINMLDQASGIYFIRFKTKQGIETRKIIKE